MTLRRKNLVGHTPLVLTYAVMLVLGFMVSTYDLLGAGSFLVTHILANSAAVLRIGFGVDKYLLWLMGALFLRVTDAGFIPESFHAPIYLLSVCAVIYLGTVKAAGKQGAAGAAGAGDAGKAKTS